MSTTTLPTRQGNHFLATLSFGLFSLIVVFSFSFLYLLLPVFGGSNLPIESNEWSTLQAYFILSFSAGLSAALSGILFWWLLLARRWRWFQAKHWSMTALFGGLLGILEMIATAWLMWIIYILFLFLFTQPGSDNVTSTLAILPLGSIGLGILTLILLIFTSKGLIIIGGIAAGAGFALLARRIFR